MSVSLNDLLAKCVDSEENFKQYCETVASYAGDNQKNMLVSILDSLAN